MKQNWKIGDECHVEDYGVGTITALFHRDGANYTHRMATIQFTDGSEGDFLLTDLGRIIEETEPTGEDEDETVALNEAKRLFATGKFDRVTVEPEDNENGNFLEPILNLQKDDDSEG